VQEIVWGNLRGFTLIYEGKLFGGIESYSFFEVWAGVHVGVLRRGDT
jgi:hypothetical protein